MNTGEKIRKRRIELGLSQNELALKVGYKSRVAINKIEKGTRGFPTKYAKAFADALIVPVEYLLVDLDDEDDEDFIKSLGYIHPLEELPEDIKALNVFLIPIGEIIQKTNGFYFMDGSQLDDSDIECLKESVQSSLRFTTDFIKKQKRKMFIDSFNSKNV